MNRDPNSLTDSEARLLRTTRDNLDRAQKMLRYKRISAARSERLAIAVAHAVIVEWLENAGMREQQTWPGTETKRL